jgi:DNA repair protein RecO (recombination protein O)
MPVVRTRALILHAFPYGDTSRILRLLTPDYGVRSVIAKGARGPRSRFGGILEPFTEGEALFNLREGRDLLTLSGFSLVRGRQALGRHLTLFAGASLLAELTLRTGTEGANPELYAFLVEALDSLADRDVPPAPTALAAAWRLVALLGFQPEMEACTRCGRRLGPDEPSRFDVEAGGAVCLACRPAGRVLDPATRREVGGMSTGNGVGPLHSPPLHAALLHAFLAAHLIGDRPLRALPLFLNSLREG